MNKRDIAENVCKICKEHCFCSDVCDSEKCEYKVIAEVLSEQLDEPPKEPCEYCALHNKKMDLNLSDMKNAINNKSIVPFIGISMVTSFEKSLGSKGMKAKFCSQCGYKLEVE